VIIQKTFALQKTFHLIVHILEKMSPPILPIVYVKLKEKKRN